MTYIEEAIETAAERYPNWFGDLGHPEPDYYRYTGFVEAIMWMYEKGYIEDAG